MKKKTAAASFGAVAAWISVSALLLLLTGAASLFYPTLIAAGTAIMIALILCIVKRDSVGKAFFLIDKYTYISMAALIGVGMNFTQIRNLTAF